jgi:SAM-dependent methyltransferase
LAYFIQRRGLGGVEYALTDSSEDTLQFAGDVLPEPVRRYQIDLLDLHWADRWDCAFLLDVLEHIPDHEAALREIRRALTPGGLLFVTVPALNAFWTWNDELAHHQRRYNRSEFRRLAELCGYELVDCRYFMFFLSPLLLGSRLMVAPKLKSMTEDQRRALSRKMHRVPHPVVNALLGTIFRCETPTGHFLPFPWGTSLLAVLRKPALAE